MVLKKHQLLVQNDDVQNVKVSNFFIYVFLGGAKYQGLWLNRKKQKKHRFGPVKEKSSPNQSTEQRPERRHASHVKHVSLSAEIDATR